MHTTRFRRMALAKFFVAGWVALFGAAIEHAKAQIINPVPPPPPPVFNPATPNTVPQAPERPVSPSAPSTLPGSESISPSVEGPPSTPTRSHRRTVTETTETPNAGKAHRGRYATGHHGRNWSRTVYGRGPSYRPPLDYDGPYCFWRPNWNGYWAPACFKYGLPWIIL